MISRTGHEEVLFTEPDITTTAPQCVPLISVALAHGWRLIQDGSYNLIDAYIGPKHIQDFKRAQRKDLRRVLTFRFASQILVAVDDKFTARTFIARCQQDALFMKAALRHPKYARKRELLLQHFAQRQIHFCVQDPESHDRRLLVPSHGGDLDLIKRLANDYENGW